MEKFDFVVEYGVIHIWAKYPFADGDSRLAVHRAIARVARQCGLKVAETNRLYGVKWRYITSKDMRKSCALCSFLDGAQLEKIASNNWGRNNGQNEGEL